MQNLHHLFTHYILCFRCLTIGRELSKIPANQAEFAQFTHRTHKLCKLHTFCTKTHPHLVHYFQTSDHRQRTTRKLERINQISCSSPTSPVNYMKFTESAPICTLDQQTRSEFRELQKCTANDASSVPFAQCTSK